MGRCARAPALSSTWERVSRTPRFRSTARPSSRGTTRTSTCSFDVKEADVVGGFTDAANQKDDFTSTGQPKLWTKDTVEIMVDPDASGDNKDYYELQINPQNKVFTRSSTRYNTPKTDPNGPFGHEDWDPKLKSAVVVRRALDKRRPTGLHRRGGDPVGGVREGREPSAEAGRHVAHELLRDEEQRRRRVVAHPGAGELPQGLAVRACDMGRPGRCTGALVVGDGRSADDGGRGISGFVAARRHADAHAPASPSAIALAVRPNRRRWSPPPSVGVDVGKRRRMSP